MVVWFYIIVADSVQKNKSNHNISFIKPTYKFTAASKKYGQPRPFFIIRKRTSYRFKYMSYLEALILGLIQGLTEFLPVSSSGHLVLFTRVTGTEASLFFDLVLHLGTLLAVIIMFRRELTDVVKKPFSKRSRMLMLSTAVSAAIVFLIKDLADNAFDGMSLPFFFMITAVALTASSFFSPKTRVKEIGALDAVIIGAAQGFAAFPGLSRSGLTASAGNLLGVKEDENASYCFILSVPIILGSALIEAIGGNYSPVPFGCLIIGFFTAFLSGILALKLIKKVFLKNRFDIFAAYLALLSLFSIINDLWLHLF